MTARKLATALALLVMTATLATGCGRRSDLDTPSMAARAEKKEAAAAKPEGPVAEATQDDADANADTKDGEGKKNKVKERPFILDKLIQ
ncbi:MAG: hypothetical protein KDJ73_05720 [Notoacmeibacter sp.]|nr:hypothetical protein [Notoacmeibacter sp.]